MEIVPTQEEKPKEADWPLERAEVWNFNSEQIQNISKGFKFKDSVRHALNRYQM